MSTTPQTAIREWDRRSNDGVDVRLLWNSQTNRVTLAVDDERSGESLGFEVDAADALVAFHHPFAYATRGHSGPAHPTAASIGAGMTTPRRRSR